MEIERRRRLVRGCACEAPAPRVRFAQWDATANAPKGGSSVCLRRAVGKPFSGWDGSRPHRRGQGGVSSRAVTLRGVRLSSGGTWNHRLRLHVDRSGSRLARHDHRGAIAWGCIVPFATPGRRRAGIAGAVRTAGGDQRYNCAKRQKQHPVHSGKSLRGCRVSRQAMASDNSTTQFAMCKCNR